MERFRSAPSTKRTCTSSERSAIQDARQYARADPGILELQLGGVLVLTGLHPPHPDPLPDGEGASASCRTSANTTSQVGVGKPTNCPISTTAPRSASISIGRPRSRSTSVQALSSPTSPPP